MCYCLNTALLPNKYWFCTLKQKGEVCNILPMKKDDIVTTPHEIVYGVNPDYRHLLLLFSVAYIILPKDTSPGGKWKS